MTFVNGWSRTIECNVNSPIVYSKQALIVHKLSRPWVMDSADAENGFWLTRHGL